VDYDSENENDLEKYLPVANATKFYDKLEPQRIKVSRSLTIFNNNTLTCYPENVF